MPVDTPLSDANERVALPAPVVRRLAGTNLVARGSVNVISIKAIRAWAGDWWSHKRADVWTYVERKLTTIWTARIFVLEFPRANSSSR